MKFAQSRKNVSNENFFATVQIENAFNQVTLFKKIEEEGGAGAE